MVMPAGFMATGSVNIRLMTARLMTAVSPDDSGAGSSHAAPDAGTLQSDADALQAPQPQTASSSGNASWHTAVVGITPNQPDRVVETAVQWARASLIGELLFIYADSTLVQIDGHSEPIDPDSLDEAQHARAEELARRIRYVAQHSGVHARFRHLGGDPAGVLAAEAKRAKTSVIIVGTRERGPLAAVEEWVRGSISVRLEHSQSIPVVVIPLGQHDGGAGDGHGDKEGIGDGTGDDNHATERRNATKYRGDAE